MFRTYSYHSHVSEIYPDAFEACSRFKSSDIDWGCINQGLTPTQRCFNLRCKLYSLC